MMRWILAAAISLLFFARGATAQSAAISSPPSDLTVLRTLQNELIAWFDSLSSSFDRIAENEDKRKLKTALVDLDKAIYDLEFNTRYLVDALRRQPVVEDEVRRAIKDTRQALNNVATHLRPVGVLLRFEYRAGGATAEKLIREAMGAKSSWLSDVEGAVYRHRIEPELIREGTRVLSANESASMSLIRVIEKLQPFPAMVGFHPTKPKIASTSLWKRIIRRFSNRA